MDYEKPEKLLNIQNANKIYLLIILNNMPKTKIHPDWFKDTQILCDGKPLCSIGSTKRELQIDIWLVNHPFYNSSQVLIDSEGRVEKFMKKYQLDFTD